MSDVLSDLARVKAIFQQRAVCAALGIMGESQHARRAERNECDCLRRPDSEDMPAGLKPVSPTTNKESE